MNTIIQTPAQCATPASGIEATVTAIVDAEPAAAPRRPFWQTEPCPAWCTEDHEARDFFGDRQHWWTVDAEIDLTMCQSQYPGEVWGPGSMALATHQHYREAEPVVDLVVPTLEPSGTRITNGEQGVQMTVAEARQLRDTLSELLAAIASPDLPVLTRDTDLGEPPLSAGEVVVTVGHARLDEAVLSSEVNHWTNRDGFEDRFEVCLDIASTVIAATPAEAREYARKLREFADIVAGHAAQAEALAKQAQL
jgi:hypothetical protein